MKKTAVCIFAHPDDEAFGPGGTIALLSQTYDVYVICATRGEAGQNHGSNIQKQISEIRENELRESAAVLGVKQVDFLDYKDGTLCNNIYHQVAEQLMEKIVPLEPEILLTYEPHGMSGHIDHVFMSMVTQYIFDRLPKTKKLMLYCLSEEQRNLIDSYYIYFPPGYKKSDIDDVVDVSSVWETKLEAIYKHVSQMKDIERIKKRFLQVKEECFLVRKRNE